ncbi:MAG TPA: TldD/PmbA family protein [Candidatus Norongarragalinales archaeon]|jgi:PmbA protein|nr:TldD/PmbA family protein [Candidatus Norongarragalinales archaeon]
MDDLHDEELEHASQRLFRVLKKTADDVIVQNTVARGTQIKFANNLTAKASAEFVRSISVFYAKDKRVVFTTLKEPSGKAINRLAKELPLAAKTLQPSGNYFGIAQGKQHYSEIRDGFDAKLFDAMYDGGWDFVENAITSALSRGARRTNGVLEIHAEKTHLRSSGGADAESKGTRHYLSLRALYDANSSGHNVCAGRMLRTLEPERVGTRAGELAVDSKNPSKAPAGVWDVVFDSLPWSSLVNHVGESASIFSVESGFSFLHDKLGQRVASSAFSLHDDGRLPEGYHSSPFDMEGTPTQDTTIIGDGTLRSYLHNTSTARKYATKTTANAGLIAPTNHNLVVAAGAENTQKMLSRVRRGIFISNLWYTRFQNYQTGDFSTIPRDAAFIIRNGQLTKAVKGMRVSDNFMQMLQNVQAVSSERSQQHGWETEIPVVCGPALVKNVHITRPSE